MGMKTIYHIVRRGDWPPTGDEYRADSLATEGFIHCSFAEQLEGVVGRYYREADDLQFLVIDPEKLASEMIVEPSTGGELYPHIYGPINVDAVIRVESEPPADAERN